MRLVTCAVLLAASSPLFAASPLAPAEALKTFQLPEGWTIELIAAEPLVVSPVAMAWDEHGRLYVAEMRDYPEADPNVRGRVRVLIDTNGDGRMDRSEIFADDLPLVNGLLPYRGGLLVTSAPNIIYLQDTNGDGRADVRRIVLIGVPKSERHEDNTPDFLINSLHYGLDNWIYAANGRSNRTLKWPDPTTGPDLPLQNTDFRFRLAPPGSPQLEPASGLSQFGLTIDEWGNRFISWNTIHIRHVVLEQQYLRRNPHFALDDPTAHSADADHGDAGRVYAISPEQPNLFGEPPGHFNATSGIEIERGGLFPAPYAGSAFVCEPLRNVIHRDELTPQGPTFIARRGRLEQDREFLASTDAWFRPVNVTTAPDGALYVADFYRGFIDDIAYYPEEHKAGLKPLQKPDYGRIYRIRPAGTKLHSVKDLSRASASQLIDFLAHPNGWYREAARRLLLERGQSRGVVTALQAMVRTGRTPQARLYGLVTLDGFGALGSDVIQAALTDENPRVREHAVRLIERLPDPKPSELIKQLTARLSDDPDARVRFQTALSLGTVAMDGSDRVEALIRIARRDRTDPWVRAAVLTALSQPEDTFAFVSRWLTEVEDSAPRSLQPSAASPTVHEGWKQYNQYCGSCHGADVTGTPLAPHLMTSVKPNGPINTQERFVETVCKGRPEKGMPAWCALGSEMIEQIYEYVKARSEGTVRTGEPAR